jgi:hypothetical protein
MPIRGEYEARQIEDDHLRSQARRAIYYYREMAGIPAMPQSARAMFLCLVWVSGAHHGTMLPW